jgi:hypothetical protein
MGNHQSSNISLQIRLVFKKILLDSKGHQSKTSMPVGFQTTKYLIISQYMCSGVLEKMLASIFRKATDTKIGVIILKDDTYEVKRRNVLYRGRIHFINCNAATISEINAISPSFLVEAFYAVHLSSTTGALKIYSGIEEQNIEKRAENVLAFLFGL